jgi:hypothetical protein
MSGKIGLVLSLLLLTACIHAGNAQSIRGDSVFQDRSVDNAIALYAHSMGNQSHLFNGTEYIVYASSNGEHPYFNDDWTDGSVYYEGQHYGPVPLLYDLSTDKLVTENAHGAPMQLISRKIKYFTLNQHVFVNMRDSQVLKEGFYDLLYDGKTKVYAQRKKALQKNISGTELQKKFEESVRYFIYKEGSYFLVKNKKDVFTLFEDQKDPLKKFVRASHLHFRPSMETAIRQMAQFYDKTGAQP